MMLRVGLFIFVLTTQVSCLDNGLALSPPMGWYELFGVQICDLSVLSICYNRRSWNQFGLDINQSLVENHVGLLFTRGSF
jgi:hypothetical protein